MRQTSSPFTRLKAVWLLFAVLATPLGPVPSGLAQGAAKPVVLFDFEDQEFGKSWSGQGGIQAARKALPEPATGKGIVPAGQGVEIRAIEKSGMSTKAGQIPKDWRRYESLAFWIYRSPEEVKRAAASTFEVHLLESDQQARFMRRVDVSHQGWERIELPMRWFRTTGGRTARWDRIERLFFQFREPANVWLDAVAVQEGQNERSCDLSEDDLRNLAFAPQDREKAKVTRTDHVLLLTNVSELDASKLTAHLGKVAETVYREMPFLEKPPQPTPVIVFRTKEEFEAFPPRFAEKLSGVIAPPQAGGYAIQGIATSFWDPIQGTLRPVYTHEFVHALLERSALLPNKREWLQEGLANRYQLRFHPQKNFPTIVANGVKNENQRLPLRVLCNGEPIAMDRYWQAMTVADMLLAEPYRKQLPDLFAAVNKSGSADLGPQLAPVLKTEWGAFETAWREHCRKAFPLGK